MGKPTLTSPIRQILLKSIKIKDKAIKMHALAAISNKQASPHHPKPSNPPEINENQRKVIRYMSCHQFPMCRPPPALHISRNLEAPSQTPYMMQTNMQKKVGLMQKTIQKPLYANHTKLYANHMKTMQAVCKPYENHASCMQTI